MRIKIIKVVSVFAASWVVSTGALAQDCDRSCLEGVVDNYLDAVIDNNPAAVPLSDDVRFTENGQQLLVGDGLWRTMKTKGDYRILIADVNAGTVGFMGTIGEDHKEPSEFTPALLSLRLRLENGEITEVEQFVARDEGAAKRLAEATPHFSFTETIPVSERMSREDLITTANKYFSGMQKNDGNGDYPFTDNCNRFENGMQTTNAPVPEGQVRSDPSDASTYSSQWGCREQFESGLLYFVNRIRDRRFVAVDEERGLVFTYVFFDHSGGDTRNGVTPSGRAVKGGPVQPWTWYIAELIKVENGQLRQIEAFLEQSPYGMTSGWSSFEDGMSDVIQDVTFK